MGILLYNLFLLLYAGAVRFLSPWNEKARLWLRGRKNFPSFDNPGKIIWMHCSSLGEFEQGRPLLEAVRKEYPSYKVALSFFSPSGYEVQKNYPGADYIFYLPADNMLNAKKLLDRLNPSLVIWVKYEYWYYYLQELKNRNIPVLLVSGIFRTGQPFFAWYGGIWRKMLNSFLHLFVQDEGSVKLLASIGVSDNVEIAGDTRFDRVISIAEKAEDIPHIPAFIDGKKVLVAGSTWDEDEIELLHFVKTRPDIKFIIAPHEVFAENLQDVKKEFPNSIFYSDLAKDNSVGLAANVLIIDNIGMLARLYRYADICFVGGGFGQDGVHNVLEAAVYGKPVVYGPVYEKYAEAVGLVESSAAHIASNPLDLEKVLGKLFDDGKAIRKSGMAAKDFVYRHKGATSRILEYIHRKRLLTN